MIGRSLRIQSCVHLLTIICRPSLFAVVQLFAEVEYLLSDQTQSLKKKTYFIWNFQESLLAEYFYLLSLLTQRRGGIDNWIMYSLYQILGRHLYLQRFNSLQAGLFAEVGYLLSFIFYPIWHEVWELRIDIYIDIYIYWYLNLYWE